MRSSRSPYEAIENLAECSMTELRLAVNEIEEDGAAELLTALESGLSLKSLDLRGNRIDPESETGRALAAKEGAF